MGVDLGDIIPAKETELGFFSGKTLAVDAFNTIYQFLASTRQYDGTLLMDSKGRVTSHLSGLFYRNLKLIKGGIRLCYVFDGKPPEFKDRTIQERAARKLVAEEKYKLAIEEGFYDEARKYAQATSRVSAEMIEESKKLLGHMGIACLTAPSEGEAQAATMAMDGLVYGVSSQDYDSLVFGSPRLVKNLSITGRRKVPRKDEYVQVNPEVLELGPALDALGISREKLVWMAILVGTDFNVGAKGIGPKKALKLVKQFDDFGKLIGEAEAKSGCKFEEYILEVKEFFMHPPATKAAIKFPEIDSGAIVRLLCDEHEFSQERVQNALGDIEKAKDLQKQKKLEQFFG